mgnify:CR=1 FL=1
MPETYGSFEALLHKLENYEGWDGEICIKTRTYEHHVPTNHYYKRKFNAERSRESGNLEVDIEGEDGQLYRDLSITFEDLKDAKYLISASNFSANNIECQGITPGFWWIYEENPRINAKGGKRRKTRKKRGKGQIFSRRRNSMIGKRLKSPEDGTVWEIIREQNGIVHLRELTDGTGGSEDGFILGPIDLSILQQIGWKFEGISSSSGSSGGRKRKTRKKALIKISCDFDSGNIIHKKTNTIKNKNIFTLEIKKDPYPKSVKKKYQNWYYFKVENAKGKKCKFIIENLVNIDNDWKGHNVVFTYNHKTFTRHPTILKNNTLSWEFTPKKNKVYFSYYVPYCLSRNYKLTSKLSKRSGVKKSILGKSPLKNKIEVLKFGKGDRNIFMIVRQHPGETIGSWMFEGFISAFFSPRSTKMRNKLINKFTFHIFPLANPDGVALGHWYTQSHGHNCNRQWHITKCPEVKMIRNYIEKQGNGCLYIDLHGDEGCQKHFITGNGKEKDDKHSPYNFFRKRMVEYNKHFQLKDYYTVKLHKVHGTFDGAWDDSLTVEGCMKHNYNRQSLELEPLKIGKHLFKSLYDWSFMI